MSGRGFRVSLRQSTAQVLGTLELDDGWMTDMQRLPLLRTWNGTWNKKSRKIGLRVAQAAAGGCVLAALSATPGCNLVNPPQLEATPTPVPTPKPDLFDPADGLTTLLPLNDNNPATPLTDKFRVVGIVSGEQLQLQALSGAAGKYVGGTADTYRLAGVLTPAQGQPGYAEVVRFIAERTLGAGKEVDVEQDPRFPQDLNAQRLVQVFYTQATGEHKGDRMLLNRMMVRLGFAVVDINAPTSIDVRTWLNDEEFARKKRLGLNALGITIGQRIPLDTPGGVIRTPAERIPPPNRPGMRRGGPPRAGTGAQPGQAPGTTTSTTSTTTTTTTSSSPGSPPSPGAAPGASSGPNSGSASAPGGPPPGSSGAPGAGGPPRGAGGPPPGAGGPAPGGRGGSPPGGRPGGGDGSGGAPSGQRL